MPARQVAVLLQIFREEGARLRERVPSLGLSPMAQGQLRIVLNRLDAETTTDEGRRGVLDGYLVAHLQERIDLVRALPGILAAHLASSPPARDDDGLWIAGLVAARTHPPADPHAHQPGA